MAALQTSICRIDVRLCFSNVQASKGDVVFRVQVRTVVREEMEGAMSKFDALLSPVAPTTAYKFGEKLANPLAMYKGDLMTVSLNLAGKCSSFHQ